MVDIKLTFFTLSCACMLVMGIWTSGEVIAQETPKTPTPPFDQNQSLNRDSGPSVLAIEAKIVSVTLSQDLAHITREADIPAELNHSVYDFGTLPTDALLDTVHASTSDGLTLDSLLIPEKDRDLRKKELESIQSNLKQMEREQSELVTFAAILDRQSSLIERNLDSNKVQGNSDLQRGMFDPNSLKILLEYGLDKQLSINRERQALTERLVDIENSIEEAKRRISFLSNRNNHRFRVQASLRNETKMPGKFRLTYFVRHCNWEPAYELRYNSDDQSFRLLTVAKITQNSGEDWTNVQLRLASASSLSQNEMPLLVPLQVRSSKHVSFESVSASNIKNTPRSDEADELEHDEIRDEWKDFSRGESNSERNRRALLLQESELRNEDQRISLLAGDGNETLGNFSIEIPRPITLVAQLDKQSIEVSNLVLVGSITHTATPLLSSFSYREVDFSDGVKHSLLGGAVSVYENEQLIGQSSLRSTQSGQPFSVGMGPDSKVRLRREVISKSKDMQGGNVREEQAVKLVIANYHENPIRVRLFDRIPLSTDQQNVAVEYSKSGPDLSLDPLYRRTLLPKNILRWDLDVPKSRYGANAFDHKYSFQVVYDKSSVLSIAFRQVSSDLEELDEMLYNLNVLSGGGGMGGMGGMGGR